jgi:hypothetical protein
VAVKPAEVAPAATLTEAGTVKFVLFEESATAAPPEGATLFSVTVQLRLLHARAETTTEADSGIWAAWEDPLRDAVTVAV